MPVNPESPRPNEPAQLPEEHWFVYKNTIEPEEIIKLRESAGWEGDTVPRWQHCLDRSLAVVGVRNPEGELVGMGCISGTVRHSVLSDLCVAPKSQGKGIGRAIHEQRLKISEERNVRYMYGELAKTNPFREDLKKYGFVVNGNSLFFDRENISRPKNRLRLPGFPRLR